MVIKSDSKMARCGHQQQSQVYNSIPQITTPEGQTYRTNSKHLKLTYVNPSKEDNHDTELDTNPNQVENTLAPTPARMPCNNQLNQCHTCTVTLTHTHFNSINSFKPHKKGDAIYMYLVHTHTHATITPPFIINVCTC